MKNITDQPKILVTKASKDYELLDSGEGEKLERFGEFVLRRPDPQAIWHKQLSNEVWEDFHAMFVNSGRTGTWKKKKDLPDSWSIELSGVKFSVSLSAFKHTGIFPEQYQNWAWLSDIIKDTTRPATILNLFGYTGGASLVMAKAGAHVCHVDGSKISVNKARENAKLSKLEDKPIRWMIDDAIAFVKREARRGNLYDGIIMDPPSYGHGPKNELWKIESHLLELIDECKKIISPVPLFVLINGYAAGYSAVGYKNLIKDLVGKNSGRFEFGELTIEDKNNRLLPAGIFARWRLDV